MTGITAFSVLLILFGSYCNPYWNSNNFKNIDDTEYCNKKLTFDQAKADTDFMMKYLNKDHPAFLNGEPADVKNAYNKSIAALRNNPNITVSYLNKQLENIVSTLHDGHTEINGCYKNYHYLKTVYWRNQNGYRLVKINGVSINDLFARKSNSFSCDYKSYGISELKDCLGTLEDLDYLGIDTNGLKYTYESNTGKTDTVVYHPSDFLTYDKYLSYNKIKDNSKKPFVSYKIYQNENAAVLTLKSCEYNNEYKNCLKAMFREIKTKNIKNIAIDLRRNGGGNSLVVDEFMRYLNVNSYSSSSEVWRMGCFMIPNFDGTEKIINTQTLHSPVTFMCLHLPILSAQLCFFPNASKTIN